MTYAQTIIQLFLELKEKGYSEEAVRQVSDAYQLNRQYLAGFFRPSGKTFIAHLVGVASILCRLKVPIELLLAGFLHSIYMHGDFRKSREEISDKKTESLVAGYSRLKWNRITIPQYQNQIPTLNEKEKNILLLRLANELEDHLNHGILFCVNAEERRERFFELNSHFTQMASSLNQPFLAQELQRVGDELKKAPMPDSSLRGHHVGSYGTIQKTRRKF